jgi:4-diphosphocytidyl-2-C-methyl-D-erythritol kinase
MIVATNTFLHEEYDSPLQSKSDLIELAKQFGSDVPFSLVGGLAIGRNRGEQLEVLEPLSFDAYFVLAISSEGLSTPQVFHRFDEIGVSSEFTDLKKPISSLTELASLMSNDLESAAISLLPSIRNGLDVLELAGAKKAMLSGSGPTVFGLFDSKELAEQAVQTLMQMGMTALVVQPSYGGTRLES